MESLAISPGAGADRSLMRRSCDVTTTFHFETNEPQYEYSFEGADVRLHCGGLVAVAAGPAPARGVPRTWFELSPVSGKRILAGVGRRAPGATAASAFEAKETVWANAMAGLVPRELAETSLAVADCVYALVDPTNGRVELGRAGRGTSALIFDGSTEPRLVEPAQSESGVGPSTSFELSAGSTLVLITHDPTEREALTSAIQRAFAARSAQDEVDAVMKCLELRNAPLRRCESIVTLHFERLDGSPAIRTPFDPPPVVGELVHDDAIVSDGISKEEFRLHHARVHSGRCRSKPSFHRMTLS